MDTGRRLSDQQWPEDELPDLTESGGELPELTDAVEECTNLDWNLEQEVLEESEEEDCSAKHGNAVVVKICLICGGDSDSASLPQLFLYVVNHVCLGLNFFAQA